MTSSINAGRTYFTIEQSTTDDADATDFGTGLIRADLSHPRHPCSIIAAWKRSRNFWSEPNILTGICVPARCSE